MKGLMGFTIKSRLAALSLGSVMIQSLVPGNDKTATCTADAGIKAHHQKTRLGCKSVDDFIKSGMTVGLGTGSTTSYALRHLSQRIQDKSLSNIVVVPCSEEVRKQCISLQIPTSTLSKVEKVDIFIDSADEIDPMLNIVKGSSGSFLREKMVYYSALKDVILVDESKLTKRLGPGFPVPVEITPYSHEHTRRVIESLPSLAGARAVLRRGLVSNNIADGLDVAVTDNGNFIVDLFFDVPIPDVRQAVNDLDSVPGVVEHGLIPSTESVVLVAHERGIEMIDGSTKSPQPWWGEFPVKTPLDRLSVDNRRPGEAESE